MKKITKLVLSLTTTAMIASSALPLAACNGGSNITTGEVEVVAYDGSQVTVTFYHTMGAALKTILDKNISEFNKAYPNIKIEHTSFGDYPGLRDQISTELTGGNAPSLAYCYPDHVALYQISNAVLPLDDHIASTLSVTKADGKTEIMGLTEEQIADYVPAYYEEGKAFGDGKMYTLPMLKSTEVLYYNKNYFEEHKANIQVPTTWEEMEEVCEYIKANPGTYKDEDGNTVNYKCIPLGYDSEANLFITMCEQLHTPYTSSKKGEYFLFNTQENRDFVKMLKGFYDKGYMTTEEINGGYTSDLFTPEKPTDVRSYMCIGSSAGAGYQCPTKAEDGSYPFEVGIAMIPQANKEDPKVISQGPSLCMFKKKNPQEVAAAWLFMEFLTTNVQLQAQMSMNNGYTCAIQSVQEHPVYANFLESADGNLNLQATSVNQTIAQQDYYYVSPAFHGSAAARDGVGVLIQNCFVNNPKNQSMDEFIKAQFDSTLKKLTQRYGK